MFFVLHLQLILVTQGKISSRDKQVLIYIREANVKSQSFSFRFE